MAVNIRSFSLSSASSRDTRKGAKALEAEIGEFLDNCLASTSVRLQTAIYAYGRRVIKRYHDTAPVGNAQYWTRDGLKSRPHLRDSLRMQDGGFTVDHIDGSKAVYRSVRLYFIKPNYRIAHLVEKGFWNEELGFGAEGKYPLRNALEAEYPKFVQDFNSAMQRQSEVISGDV